MRGTEFALVCRRRSSGCSGTWDSDSPTSSTQENPRSSHWLGLETLRNRGSGGLLMVMTEEVAGISQR